MTYKQVQWAKQHDWYVSAYEFEPGHWAVTVSDMWFGGSWKEQYREFDNFKHLQLWAGC